MRHNYGEESYYDLCEWEISRCGFFQVSSHYKVQHRGDDGPRGLITYTLKVLVKGCVLDLL